MKIKIWDKIVNDILSDINQGILKPNEKLPTNQELAKKYNTSGVTVRKSIAILINKGYLRSIERVGTFVKEREKDIFLVSFSLEANINETITAIRVDESKQLNRTKKDVKIYLIKYFYYSDTMPIAYVIDSLYVKGNFVSDKRKAEKNIDQIEMIFNSFDVQKKLEITMELPDSYVCQKMFWDEATPVICFTLTYETQNRQPVGRKKIYLAGENVDLKGKAFHG